MFADQPGQTGKQPAQAALVFELKTCIAGGMAKAKEQHGGPRSPKGGRPKGSKGKATIEREINAAQVIDRARREGRDLAVTVLENLMNIALGATGLNRPTSKRCARRRW